jgi:hypothetical protein
MCSVYNRAYLAVDGLCWFFVVELSAKSLKEMFFFKQKRPAIWMIMTVVVYIRRMGPKRGVNGMVCTSRTLRVRHKWEDVRVFIYSNCCNLSLSTASNKYLMLWLIYESSEVSSGVSSEVSSRVSSEVSLEVIFDGDEQSLGMEVESLEDHNMSHSTSC